MGSFKSSPLSSFLLIVLLGAIVAILIAPQIDLPDTAFQRNSSPVAVNAQFHQVTQTNAVGNIRQLNPLLAESPILALNDRFGDRAIEVHSAHPLILRC